MAQFGVAVFFPNQVAVGEARMREMKAHPGFGPYHTAMNSPNEFSAGYRYTDVKMLVGLSKCKEVQEVGGLEGFFKGRVSDLAMQPRQDLLPALDFLKPAKGLLLRKLVDSAFKQHFAADKETRGGGNFVYTFSHGTAEVSVWVDFGSSFMGQMRYGLSVRNSEYKIKVTRLCYESLWCQYGGWDYLTEENAQRSIELLPELVQYLVKLGEQVNELTKG